MRKKIFVLLFLFASLYTIAQDTYHAVTLTDGVWNTYKEQYKWDDAVVVDLQVTVKGKFVNIYSKKPQAFRILNDGENLDAYSIQWYAIDQDGDHCQLRFTNMDGNFFIAINYSNICYYYKLENY